MSAGVSDQRMKGQGNQVNNGPKEQLGAGEGGQGGATGGSSEDFESWRSQQQQQPGQQTHTPYGGSVPISSATDPYSMSTAAGYYGSGGTFPYQAFGVGDGTWSNGTDPMTFLGGYTHDSYSMDGMFGPSTTFSTTAFGQPSAFNYFHGNGDYSTWGNQLNQRKPHYDDYYRTDTQNMYATAQQMQDTNLTLKSVEQGMQNLNIDMTNTGNLHISHNIGGGPQLAKGDGKDMKNSTTSDGVKDIQPKKMTWASIASQPAKPQVTIQSSGLKKKGPGMPPGPIVPGKHNMDIGTWDTNKSTPPQLPVVNSAPPPPKSATPSVNIRPAWSGPVRTQSGQPQLPQGRPLEPPPQPQTQQPQQAPQQHYMTAVPQHHPPPVGMPQMAGPGPLPGPPPQPQSLMMPPPPAPTHPVLDELRVKNNYNPTEFDLSAPGARFFVIKSYSEDDIHRSIKYEIWCSTEHGNKRLDQAYREREKEPNGCVYLFFSVNGSGHFCGMAQMISSVDYHSNSSVWSQDKWKGQFRVRWVYVKDVPNVQLRHIHLENNENKPVTNSRDAQEVPHNKGLQVLRIIHSYRHSTSIFDDFIHYEKRQEEEDNRKVPEPHRDNHHGGGRENYHGGRENHHGGRDGHHGGRENHHGGRDNYHGNQRDNPRDGGRDHRGERGGGGGRNQDRGEPVHDGGHRGGSHRSHDNSHGPKDRSENNSRGGRGRGGGGGRNMN